MTAEAQLPLSSLADRYKRLVDSGLRLNQLRSEAELHDFLIDEVTELSGAERVLLVLWKVRARGTGAGLQPQEVWAPWRRQSFKTSCNSYTVHISHLKDETHDHRDIG